MGLCNSEPQRLSIPASAPTVFVIDDNISIRESIAGLINYAGWHVESFASAEEFLARPATHTASCLLLDVNLPDLNGLELQERIADDRIDMPIIFITGDPDIPTTVRAMKAGAIEFLVKPLSEELLLAAVENALGRSEKLVGKAAALAELRDRHASLSKREREVMALMTSGKPNKQIGRELGISELTVKSHRGKVMSKMGSDSLADLVRIAACLSLRVHNGDHR